MRVLAGIFLLSYVLSVSADDLVQFTVLDVGEGQSLIVQKNKRALMIDTGHAGEVGSVLNRLAVFDIESIDVLILTHLHPDHASGFFRLYESFPELKTYHNCQPLADDVQPDMVRWVRDALQTVENIDCVKAGNKINFDDIKISVLWPEKIINNNLNENSLVLNIKFQDVSILVMGDAGFAAEQYLLSKGVLNQKIDVLVVGHHGAKDASSEVFISKLKPEYSVISVNKSNIRGYPSLEVVERLKKYSAHVLTTNQSGDLVFSLDDGRLYYQH